MSWGLELNGDLAKLFVIYKIILYYIGVSYCRVPLYIIFLFSYGYQLWLSAMA